jgi:hypothetical protein
MPGRQPLDKEMYNTIPLPTVAASFIVCLQSSLACMSDGCKERFLQGQWLAASSHIYLVSMAQGGVNVHVLKLFFILFYI